MNNIETNNDAAFIMPRREFNFTKLPLYLKNEYPKADKDASNQSGNGLPVPFPDFIEGLSVLVVGIPEINGLKALANRVGVSGKIAAVQLLDKDVNCSNIKSLQGDISEVSNLNIEVVEGLDQLQNLPECSYDLVLMNSLFNVINQKEFMHRAFDLLKDGGEFYISSLFVKNLRLDDFVKDNELARNNLIAGAMYASDFRRVLSCCGIYSHRFIEKRDVNLKSFAKRLNKKVRKHLKNAEFYYGIVRTFKLYDLEDSCENYKLFVTYNGKAKGCEQFFDLDETHRLFTDEELEVCGNTYSFLMNTRFGKYFKGRGNKSRHYGIYDYCGYCSGGKGGAFKKPLEPFKKSKKKAKDIEFPELKLKDCKLCTEGDCSSCKS